MKFHPYSDLFPLIEGADFDALVGDIKTHGLREKIWLFDGKILDGRNRYLACKQAKIKPNYRQFTGKDALAFVLSVNMQRRHLSINQRALIAARIATMQAGVRTDLASIEARSQRDSADELKVSRSTVQRAKQILERGSKALQQAVESDEVSLSKAAKVVDLPKAKQLKAAIEKKPEAAPDFDFTDYEPEDDEAYKQNVENVMMADDKLAAMLEELKQVHREMAGIKASRDHYQSESGAATRIVKTRDREIEKLKKELAKARDENEALRERVAIMDAA